MKLTSKLLGLFTLLALATTSSTVRADPEKQKPKDVQQEILDEIKNLNVNLSLSINQTKAEVKDLRDTVKKLDDRVRALEILNDQIMASARRNTRFSPSNPSTRISAYPPGATSTGTIQLRNTSLTFVQVFLNGKTYNLAEGFGEITPTLTRNLGDNDTYTITIYPR